MAMPTPKKPSPEMSAVDALMGAPAPAAPMPGDDEDDDEEPAEGALPDAEAPPQDPIALIGKVQTDLDALKAAVAALA